MVYSLRFVCSGVAVAVICCSGYQKVWDDFFTQLQPTMTHLPYHAVPGNHELIFNFLAYRSRFFQSGLGATPDPGLEAWANQGIYSQAAVKPPQSLLEQSSESKLSEFKSAP